MAAPDHVAWLEDTGEVIETADGSEAEIWVLQHADEIGQPRLFRSFIQDGGYDLFLIIDEIGDVCRRQIVKTRVVRVYFSLY